MATVAPRSFLQGIIHALVSFLESLAGREVGKQEGVCWYVLRGSKVFRNGLCMRILVVFDVYKEIMGSSLKKKV